MYPSQSPWGPNTSKTPSLSPVHPVSDGIHKAPTARLLPPSYQTIHVPRNTIYVL